MCFQLNFLGLMCLGLSLRPEVESGSGCESQSQPQSESESQPEFQSKFECQPESQSESECQSESESYLGGHCCKFPELFSEPNRLTSNKPSLSLSLSLRGSRIMHRYTCAYI